ncbi:hypothetical protein KKB55_00190, partial [Myxococcota bacterium]|nr:hypothetical protein [Myxococcota bacterium]
MYAIVELSAEECCRIKFAEDTRNNISLKSHYENENNHKYRLIDFPFDRKIEGAEYKINIRNDDIQNGDQNTLKSININI